MDKPVFPATNSHPLNPDAAPGSPEALHPYVDNGGDILSPGLAKTIPIGGGKMTPIRDCRYECCFIYRCSP